MNRRRNFVWTPRRTAAAFAIVLALAFAASSISLEARAGSDAAAQSTSPRPESQHLIATRIGTVYPQELPPATLSIARHSRPLRVADPVAYRMRKAALNAGGPTLLPELPSLGSLASTASPTFSTNFAGLGFPDSQCGADCEPPDTQVAAGPNNVVELTNIVMRVFDKSGNVLKTTNLNTFFGVSPMIFSSDPRVEYDTLSGRWFISFLIFDTDDINTAQNGFWYLAASTDSNPLDAFNMYSVDNPGSFPDQPPLGFNDDKVVTGGNAFSCATNCGDMNLPNGGELGNEFLVWNKAELLAGDSTIDTDFYPPFQDDSDFPIIPAKSRSSTSTLWMVSAFNNVLNVWSITGVPGVGMGSMANDVPLTIRAFSDPPDAKQEGSSSAIDAGDSRLVDAVFRDGIMWASGTDTCQPNGDPNNRSCLQYFEVLTGASPTVNQHFSFGTPNAYDYYPSVDLDSSDDLITSFTQSSSTEFASAYVDGRRAADAIDTLGTPQLFQAGTNAYNGTRWGDYSGAGIDPSDETAIWVASEYATSASTGLNWGTWIAKARIISGSPTATATRTATATGTPTGSPSASTTPTMSGSPSATPSATPTISATSTATATPTATASATPTGTTSSTSTASPTSSPTATPTGSGSATATPSATPTISATATDTATSTATASETASPTPTATATITPTATTTATPTSTGTPTPTPTPTAVGVLKISTNEVSFGTVKVNSTKSKHITVQNKGKFPLDVTVGNLSAPFSITSGSGNFMLSKGKKKTLTIKFKPTATGDAQPEILSIHSNDPVHSSHPVTVTGAGK